MVADHSKGLKARLETVEPDLTGKGVLGVLTKGAVGLCRGAFYVSIVVVIFMLLILAVDVTLRVTGNTPTAVGFEFTEYGLLWLSILPTGLYLFQGKHISVDFFYDKFNPTMKTFSDYVSLVCTALFSLVVTVYGIKMTVGSFETGELTNSALGVPLYWIEIWVPVAFGLLTLIALLMIALRIRYGKLD